MITEIRFDAHLSEILCGRVVKKCIARVEKVVGELLGCFIGEGVCCFHIFSSGNRFLVVFLKK